MADTQELRELIEAERVRFDVAAVSVVVIADREVILADGFGRRDTAQDLPATATTLFALASDTKHFVAAACAMLVDEGLLEWDRPVRNYLPEFRMHDDRASDLVTVRDLLSHRTGLPRHDALNVWGGSRLPAAEVVRRLQHLQPSAPLRQAWQYNNLCFTTAGHLLGVLTGSDWESVVQSRLLDPLGMSATCFGRLEAEKTGDYAVGYDMEGVAVPARGDGHRGPAGGIVSHAEDVARWLLARLGEPSADGRRVLSDAAIKAVTTPTMIEPTGLARFPELVKTGYALGATTLVYRGIRVVHHGGNIDGFCSDLHVAPDEGHAVAVLANASGSGVRDALTLAILDRLTGLPPLPWGERWHALMASYRGGLAQARNEVRAAGAGRPPSRPLAEFAGRYTHRAYDALEVEVVDEELHVRWHDLDELVVRHKDVDVWDFQIPGYDQAVTLSFRAGPQGVEDAVLPLEPMVDPIVFTRQPLALAADELARLVGAYVMGPIALTVQAVDDGLVAEVSGLLRVVLAARGPLRFTVTGKAGVTAEFALDDTGVAHRVLLAPYGVFHRTELTDG